MLFILPLYPHFFSFWALMASYYRDHALIADGNCEWGSQCSCSLNGRRHSYSIDLLRRTVSSVEMKTRF